MRVGERYFFTYADGALDTPTYEIYILEVEIIDTDIVGSTDTNISTGKFQVKDVLLSHYVGFPQPQYRINEMGRLMGYMSKTLFKTLKEAQHNVIRRVMIKDNLWSDIAV